MLPFPRGEFVDSLPEGILGKVYAVADNEVKGLTGRNSNEYVYLKVVKNSSGIALLPKRLAKPKISSTIGFETEIAGYTTVDAEDCYPIDEYLPASGVPDANYFYVVVGGPATVLTSLAGDARNVISEMNMLTNTAGATTGATSGGRAQLQNIQASTVNATAGEENAEQIQRALGRAVSNKTTNNTDADLLMHVRMRW